jgi:hypothetical protein
MYSFRAFPPQQRSGGGVGGVAAVCDNALAGSGRRVVPASFLADGPFDRTVAARIFDKDGLFTRQRRNDVAWAARP